jgi:DNA-binding transcriptional MerR regulator
MGKTEQRTIKIGELVEQTGARLSTLKWYSEIGIIPFEQRDTRLIRRYDKDKVEKRLHEIDKLKDKGLSIPDIIKKLGSTGK